MEALRQKLCDQLDESITFTCFVSASIKRTVSLRALLQANKDKALDNLNSSYLKAEEELKKRKCVLEEYIGTRSKEKEIMLEKEKLYLTEVIKETANTLGDIEDALTSEPKLLQEGQKLDSRMKVLIMDTQTRDIHVDLCFTESHHQIMDPLGEVTCTDTPPSPVTPVKPELQNSVTSCKLTEKKPPRTMDIKPKTETAKKYVPPALREKIEENNRKSPIGTNPPCSPFKKPTIRKASSCSSETDTWEKELLDNLAENNNLRLCVEGNQSEFSKQKSTDSWQHDRFEQHEKGFSSNKENNRSQDNNSTSSYTNKQESTDRWQHDRFAEHDDRFKSVNKENNNSTSYFNRNYTKKQENDTTKWQHDLYNGGGDNKWNTGINTRSNSDTRLQTPDYYSKKQDMQDIKVTKPSGFGISAEPNKPNRFSVDQKQPIQEREQWDIQDKVTTVKTNVGFGADLKKTNAFSTNPQQPKQQKEQWDWDIHDRNNNRDIKKTGFSADLKKPSEFHSEQKVQKQNTVQKKKSIIAENLESGSSVINAVYLRTIGIGRQGSGPQNLNYPLGVTVNVDKKVIVCDSGSNSVKIFQWSGEHLYTIMGTENEKFVQPSAVVTNKKGEIFVKDRRMVRVFSSNGNFLRKFGSGVLKRPFGLVINDDQHIMVLDYDYQDIRIVVFDQQGKLIRKFAFKVKNVKNSKCRFMAIVRDKLIVSDLGLNKVYITDTEGNLKTEFGELGDLPGNFVEPSGVVADGCGNIVIGDSKNNRIQVFTEDGEFCSVISFNKQQLFRPSDLHLTDDGYLVVSNLLGHAVKIYKIQEPSKK